MPIYEFECMKCGEGFEELFRSVSERRRPSCPQCSSKRLRKRVSVFSAGA
ncbi:MAG: zinc ribbon domain-containing protein [Planctomycetia bacterium]|nr:zinc ribbon domain-containing protein [Planctomycetia bacterium]